MLACNTLIVKKNISKWELETEKRAKYPILILENTFLDGIPFWVVICEFWTSRISFYIDGHFDLPWRHRVSENYLLPLRNQWPTRCTTLEFIFLKREGWKFLSIAHGITSTVNHIGTRLNFYLSDLLIYFSLFSDVSSLVVSWCITLPPCICIMVKVQEIFLII